MIGKKLFANIPQYYWVATIGWISRIASALSKIIAIPIVFGYLGQDLYAAFILIVGLSPWFSLIDFGIAKSLQNYLSLAHVQGDDCNALMGNTAILLMLLFVVSIITFSAVAYPLQYVLLQHIAYRVATEQWYILLIVGNIYILTALLNVSFSVFFAEFRAYVAYTYQFLQAVSSVIAVILVRYLYFGPDKLFVILLFWAGAPFLVAMVAYFHSFPVRRVFSLFDKSIIKSVLVRGIKFWGFYVGTIIGMGANYLIMSQTLPPKEITIYYILERLFNVIFFVYQAVLAVIWPKLSELFVSQLHADARKMLMKNLWLGAIAMVISTVMILLAKQGILQLLISRHAEWLVIPASSILLFGVYFVQRIFAETYTVGLQSQNRLKIFWLYMPFQILIGVIAMYLLSKIYGLNGILLGLIISTLVTANVVLPIAYYSKR